MKRSLENSLSDRSEADDGVSLVTMIRWSGHKVLIRAYILLPRFQNRPVLESPDFETGKAKSVVSLGVGNRNSGIDSGDQLHQEKSVLSNDTSLELAA